MRKVEIELNKKKARIIEEKRGPILPRHDPEYLPRRRGGLYVRLFDFGRLANGDDIDFIFDPSPAFTVGPGGGYGFSGAFDYGDEWNAFILAIDRDDWATTFSEITEIDRYGLEIDGQQPPHRPGKGYRTDTMTVIDGSYAVRLLNFGTFGLKITNTPVFSDPPVSFGFDANVDLFLTPVIASWMGGAQSHFAGPIHYEYQFYAGRRPYPRSFFLDNPDLDGAIGDPAYAHETGENPIGIPLFSSTLRSAWHTLMTSASDAQLVKVQYGYNPGSSRVYISHTVEDPADFPTILTPGIDTVYSQDPANEFDPRMPVNLTMIDQPGGHPTPMIIAAIRKGAEWYYLWRASPHILIQGPYRIVV